MAIASTEHYVNPLPVNLPVYYQDDLITIINGDCQEIMARMQPGSIDLVFTSPPYNMGNSTGGGMRGIKTAGKWKRPLLSDGYDATADNLPHDVYVGWQHHILEQCWDLLLPTGAIYYNHKQRIFNGEVVTPLAYNPGLPLRQVIIWARAGGINFSPSHYVPTDEWILLLAKPDFRLKSKGASGIGSIWYVPQEANPDHPAPFPLALPARAIETTLPGIVLDPFCGSGTVLRAAKNAGRRAIGIDISEAYCELAAKRMSQSAMIF